MNGPPLVLKFHLKRLNLLLQFFLALLQIENKRKIVREIFKGFWDGKSLVWFLFLRKLHLSLCQGLLPGTWCYMLQYLLSVTWYNHRWYMLHITFPLPCTCYMWLIHCLLPGTYTTIYFSCGWLWSQSGFKDREDNDEHNTSMVIWWCYGRWIMSLSIHDNDNCDNGAWVELPLW